MKTPTTHAAVEALNEHYIGNFTQTAGTSTEGFVAYIGYTHTGPATAGGTIIDYVASINSDFVGDWGFLNGMFFNITNLGAGDVSRLTGVWAEAHMSSPGDIATQIALTSQLGFFDGHTDNGYGTLVQAPLSFGDVDNVYGLYIKDPLWGWRQRP